MTHDERIERVAGAIAAEIVWAAAYGVGKSPDMKKVAEAALAAAGVEGLEQEVTRLRDSIAHAIIMLQTGMPEYDAHDVLDVLREVIGK
jgi:hypothetical protein